MLNKSYLLSAFLLSATLGLQAQMPSPYAADSLPYPQILTDMPNARVVQDTAITMLMQDKIAGIVRGEMEMSGWRVQVYSSNTPIQSKNEALALESRLKEAIDQPIYIVSTPPFIKVRIGDFVTQDEAKAYKEIFIQQFPEMVSDTYVVRDEHIKIKR